MREKLIELLKQTNTELRKQPGAKVWGDFADHLIANGVTIPVRCKDCKGMNEDKFCVAWEGFVREEDFCSYGERREGE